MPSLVSIPLLGYRDYDRNIYANTRKRLLSSQTNSYYFQGKEFKVRHGSIAAMSAQLLSLFLYARQGVWLVAACTQ